MNLQCTLCELHRRRTQVVPGEGNTQARIMLVGECPGPDEDKAGRPFIGRSGKLLRQTLQYIGIDEQSVYITNIVKCFPKPKLNPSKQHVEACSHYLEQEIHKIVVPSIIVAVGKTSSSFLVDGGITSIMKIAGRVLTSRFGLVLPVPHPSYCLRKGIPADKYAVYFTPLLMWR